MTNELTKLIEELRKRSRVYAMVGDYTPSGLLTRAANELEALDARVTNATKAAYSAGYDAARTVRELEAAPVVDMDAARWTFADAAVVELRKGHQSISDAE